MREKKLVTLIYGFDLHYVDHLAPLAWLLNIPLVVTDIEIEGIIEEQYPNVNLIWQDNRMIHPYIVKSYDTVISCFSRRYYESYFSLTEELINKRLSYIWCPHGNSDKDNLEALKEEKNVFIYGEQMKQRLSSKVSKSSLHTIGNYRYQYYLAHKKSYDLLVQKKVFSKFERELPTFLYAPTWRDYELSSSFEKALPLLKHFPKEFNLIVKFHPNTWIQNELAIERLAQKYEGANILFLKNFQPILPLLNHIQGYIGDHSSIGYDCLLFDKPMIFFTNKKNFPLSSCGYLLEEDRVSQIEEYLQKSLKNPNYHLENQKEVREQAFDLIDKNTITERLRQASYV